MSDAAPVGDDPTILKEALLRQVASEDIDSIPDDLPDPSRFLVSAVRAAMRKSPPCSLCVFLHSNAPVAEGKPHGFVRVSHMQDGHGDIDGHIILTNRDAVNGTRRALSQPTIDGAMDDLESMGLGGKQTLIWDGQNKAATFYPKGTVGDAEHKRYVIRPSTGTLTQDEVCEILNTAYNDNFKNPSAHTVKLWVRGKLISNAEEEIERHLKGQLSIYFLAKSRRVKIIPQTNTNAGRTDLIFLQRPASGSPHGPEMVGVLELKVRRGPGSTDWSVTTQGLSQGFHYRDDLELPFATLALYDVGKPPSHDIAPLLENQDPEHVAVVRARRFPMYRTPREWRDAGGYAAS
jgi:hypothetical protein